MYQSGKTVKCYHMSENACHLVEILGQYVFKDYFSWEFFTIFISFNKKISLRYIYLILYSDNKNDIPFKYIHPVFV